MLIQIILNEAERQFIHKLEELGQSNVGCGVLLCAFSQTSFRPAVDSVLATLKDELHDHHAEIFFCADGDMAIVWRGQLKDTLDMITRTLLKSYKSELPQDKAGDLFRFYDTNAQGEDLRLIFMHKLKILQSPPNPPEQASIKNDIPAKQSYAASGKQGLSEKQVQAIRAGIVRRQSRRGPELLIVEDQEFSRKLLLGLFERQYTCYGAKNAQDALALYAEHVPDIVFLDIELPDFDGHRLASIIKSADPESYIVMVTGNHYPKDVEMAKTNKVQGFIVKPYNKQKIMATVDSFMQKHKHK